jgi:hypothetical protein
MLDDLPPDLPLLLLATADSPVDDLEPELLALFQDDDVLELGSVEEPARRAMLAPPLLSAARVAQPARQVGQVCIPAYLWSAPVICILLCCVPATRAPGVRAAPVWSVLCHTRARTHARARCATWLHAGARQGGARPGDPRRGPRARCRSRGAGGGSQGRGRAAGVRRRPGGPPGPARLPPRSVPPPAQHPSLARVLAATRPGGRTRVLRVSVHAHGPGNRALARRLPRLHAAAAVARRRAGGVAPWCSMLLHGGLSTYRRTHADSCRLPQ